MLLGVLDLPRLFLSWPVKVDEAGDGPVGEHDAPFRIHANKLSNADVGLVCGQGQLAGVVKADGRAGPDGRAV